MSCQKERERLDNQARELDRQGELLSKNLAKVSAELLQNRDGLVNQFLAISPLLSQLNLVAGAAPRESAASSAIAPATSTEPEARPAARVFTLPAFVRSACAGATSARSGFSSASASTSSPRGSSIAASTWPAFTSASSATT